MKEVLIEGDGDYKVRIEPEGMWDESCAHLFVTHNGYQWSGIKFSEKERPLIIKALKQFKFKKKKTNAKLDQ